MASSSGSESYFYLVPAFTVAVSVQAAHQLDGYIHLPDTSPHTIRAGAHVVFDHKSDFSHHEDTVSIHEGTTYFVSKVEVVAGGGRKIKVSRQFGAQWCHWDSHNFLPRGTHATFAVHDSPSECNKAPEVFAADIQAFQANIQKISALARPSLQLSLSSHPFEQVFSKGGPSPCWRALLKVSAAADIDIRSLRVAGRVLLYPAHQFAMQALMGVSSSQTVDLTKVCGGAFLDTFPDTIWQPSDSLEEYCKKTAFNNIRNIFAHSFEQSSSTALPDAAKTWCFKGTNMQTQDSSSFWVNSDVLSYVFTATPLAFFLPLCYRVVCSKLRERRKVVKVDLECELMDDKRGTKPTLRVFVDFPNVQTFINEDDCMVTLDQRCGPLQKGVTYHVVSSTDATKPSSGTTFGVSLRRKGQPVVLLKPVSRPQAAAKGPSSAAASSPSIRATFQRPSDYLQEDAILSCMPADLPPREVPSLLDLYFNYNKPLAELMSQLERGSSDEDLFDPVCAGNIKKHQYSRDEIDGQAIGSLFCRRFAALRKAFNDKVAALFRLHKSHGSWAECGKDLYADVSLWCKDAGYSIDSSAGGEEPKVWLGLSRVGKFEHPDLDVRIPRAIKSQPPARSPEFEKLMATLKTGSNIASATKHRCLIVNSQEGALYPEIPESDAVNSKNLPEMVGGSPFAGEAWVSEAGICTLKELFADGVSDAERRTFAFRNLMRQIFHDMALAVSQLHDCGIVHHGIDEGFFKIFPIWESPIQRLRVKLVGLKKAATGANFSGDIKQLGKTMLRLATVLPGQQHHDSNLRLPSLKSYDPSLYFLLSWMLSDSPPDVLEVLRHPYFMTPAERQTFGIALGGGKTCGMIGSYLCANPHKPVAKNTDDALWSAVQVELTQHLDRQLGAMFDAAGKASTVVSAPASSSSGGGGSSSTPTAPFAPASSKGGGGWGKSASSSSGGGGFSSTPAAGGPPSGGDDPFPALKSAKQGGAAKVGSSSSSYSPLPTSSSVPPSVAPIGIGVTLNMEKNGHVTIGKVKPGKGAADADIRPGNRILKVAGKDVTSRVVAPMTIAEAQDALDRVTNLLIGTPGTTVELLIEFGIYSPTKKTCIVTRKL